MQPCRAIRLLTENGFLLKVEFTVIVVVLEEMQQAYDNEYAAYPAMVPVGAD